MKKVIVLMAPGYEEIEALTVVDVLKRGEICCDICSVSSHMEVKSSNNILIKSDKKFKEVNFEEYDALIIPGGMPGSTNLRDNVEIINLVKEFNNKNKLIAAICAGPIVLGKAGVLKDKRATSYPGFEKELNCKEYVEEIVVQDSNIITSRGPAIAIYFAFKILENLIEDKEKIEKIKKDMLLHMIK
ncbi:DJ-1 family glyoxalase III [Clostridium niameyense]|uniref:DJ-1 family glyoxalase III n=1 Tax=Clostridium niameyense TaxID=1622073 RepID=UPI00067EE924|nr:DJ-1 family glyoxalase III [Clostridium niameyense]